MSKYIDELANERRNEGKIVASFNKHTCPCCGKELTKREVKLKRCAGCRCTINFVNPISTTIVCSIIIGGFTFFAIQDPGGLKEEFTPILAGILIAFICSCIFGGFKLYVNFIRECIQWLFGTGKYSDTKGKKWFK